MSQGFSSADANAERWTELPLAYKETPAGDRRKGTRAANLRPPPLYNATNFEKL